MAQSADSTCLCEICIGGPGEYYCQQCDQFFCGNCKLSHLRANISKKHTFFSGQNINKEEKRLCIEHEERFLFYCHGCDTPVCRSCSLQTHHGHLMTDLTKSAVKLKFELVKIIESTITTSTLCIDKIEEDTKTYHQKIKAVNKTITEEGNYYKEFIDKKVHSFVKLVQDETQKALGSLSTATKVYLEILEHCQQWQKKIKEMETTSDVLLFKKLKHLKTDVDQILLKQSLDTPRPSVSYTNKQLSVTDINNLFGELTFQYQKEKSDRMSSDNISTKYKKENDRLRKERNSARTELQRVLREKNESYQNLNTEHVLAKEELQSKEREKSELVALFKDREEKDLQKLKRFEKDIETLRSKYRDDNEEMRQSEHEIESLKSKWKEDNDKIQRLEHEIENLKSRLTGEKANRYSAYEMMQNKNDLETCKHQKKALEDERNELQKENMELENELQSLYSKLEQFENSVRNISNLKKQIKDHEEGYRKITSKLHEAERQMGEQKETIEDQKQENRKIYKEKKDLENKLRLALNNEEQTSLGKEFENLKTILQKKQEELYNLKSRFQKLTDSKETSEVLNKIIESLKQENSDLNQRLEINNDEKSSIHRENKELKNILQDKLSEVKRLETRLQQYAEKFEDIPALKSHMDKLQSDNDDLNRKCRHLQTVEKDIQKLKREKQQLETEIISQRQNNETLNNRLEILDVEKLEIEDRLRRRSPQVVTDHRNCQNCFKYRNDISDLKREIVDLRDRMSEAAWNKLRDNNPNIGDLSDIYRPTSLAEKFLSLYTEEYTDAIEVIENDMDEAASVKVMLDWLKKCYEWCQRLAKEQRETLINRSIGFMENHGGQKVVLSDRCLIFVKEFQKKIAVESLAVVGQICHVKSVTQQTLSSEKYIVKYIKKCSELCWMMQISDPPLYLNFDVNSGENLNKNDYNVFTKSGSKIDYLVWPVLYLHITGPMLVKGVAQGK